MVRMYEGGKTFFVQNLRQTVHGSSPTRLRSGDTIQAFRVGNHVIKKKCAPVGVRRMFAATVNKKLPVQTELLLHVQRVRMRDIV